jgi:hypothetical protein
MKTTDCIAKKLSLQGIAEVVGSNPFASARSMEKGPIHRLLILGLMSLRNLPICRLYTIRSVATTEGQATAFIMPATSISRDIGSFSPLRYYMSKRQTQKD